MSLSNRRGAAAALLALAVAVPAAPLAAQRADRPADVGRIARDRGVRKALDTLRTSNAWTLDEQVSICEIPAPPFKERARAEELKRRFERLGLAGVRIDSVGNVIGERAGRVQDGPTVVISGHLDTVFPEGTDVKVKRDTANGGARLTAPGIGDDCRGLAVLLSVARALDVAKVRTAGSIVFVGTVGEEGEGNLRGVRHLFARGTKSQIDYFISVDGTGSDVTHRAVGSNRYRVTYRGPGGHSYGAFGMPNPTHALGRAIAKLADVQVPASPKTTFNVGVIRGGTSVNSIAGEASMDIDMRSESAEALAAVDAQVQRAIQAALAEEKARWPKSDRPLAVVVDTIGLRPAGGQRDDAPIVRAALAAAGAVGLRSELTASSTDANVPIALGIPAITIDGGGRGFGSHSLAERYEDGPEGWKGPQWALLVALSLAGGLK